MNSTSKNVHFLKVDGLKNGGFSNLITRPINSKFISQPKKSSYIIQEIDRQ